ncbi:hypothetical protein VNO77_23388 [Canavalia gladiata]|uniref:Uncharacterized protein n=1 Tax=Canavalia gladiata TaxID=3824 RepID=A0AAN9L562_CANGL
MSSELNHVSLTLALMIDFVRLCVNMGCKGSYFPDYPGIEAAWTIFWLLGKSWWMEIILREKDATAWVKRGYWILPKPTHCWCYYDCPSPKTYETTLVVWAVIRINANLIVLQSTQAKELWILL